MGDIKKSTINLNAEGMLVPAMRGGIPSRIAGYLQKFQYIRCVTKRA